MNIEYEYMDYSLFTFNAVVDILEVRIHTTRKNHGGHMKSELGKYGFSYFTPVQPDAGGWTSYFTVPLYDIRSFAALQSKLEVIQGKFPLASRPTVSMIEVAFDGRVDNSATTANHNYLAALAARMAFRLAEPVSTNRRLFRDRRGITAAMPRTLEALERKMAEGWNVGIGDKTDDRYQHCYLKTTDYNKKPLPVQDYRARFEIRLAGAGLPHTDIESYRDFRFETLSQYISFRKEDINASPLQQAIVTGYGDQASHRKTIKRRNGGGIRKAIIPRDRELNEIVRKRLQTLTKRWQ